ncbi:MAG: DNA-binding protein [Burkholderiaceae bacterium]
MNDLDTARLKKIRNEFINRGESIADWARHHHFRTSMVYAILAGRQKCLRGEGHRVAVALGLKPEPAEKN